MTITLADCADTIANVVNNQNSWLAFGSFSKQKDEVKNHYAYTGAPCHGSLSGMAFNDKSIFYTSVPFRGRATGKDQGLSEVQKRWLEYILSDEGPYKTMLAGRERMIFDGSKFATGYAFEVYPDDDRVLLSNLTIASRVGYEYANALPLIRELVDEHGLGFAEAMLLSSRASLKDGRQSVVVNSLFAGSGHSITTADGEFPKAFNLFKFEKGEPTERMTFGLKSARTVYGHITTKFCSTVDPKQNNLIKLFKDTLTPSKVVIPSRWAVIAEANQVSSSVKDFVKAWKEEVRPKYQAIFPN